ISMVPRRRAAWFARARAPDSSALAEPHQPTGAPRWQPFLRLPQSGRIRALSPLRRNNPDQARELGMSHGVHRPVPDLGARRVLPKEVFTLPVLRRPDRPRDESPAAVGADVIEDIFNARRAERTFVSANARFQ